MATNSTPGIKWFSRFLPILKENKGLTTSQKRTKAEKDCRKILKIQSGGKYRIPSDGFKWEGPTKDEPRHKLTVFIVLKRGRIPGPSDPPIPATKNPPPSM